MGLTVLDVEIANPAQPERTVSVEFLIDSAPRIEALAHDSRRLAAAVSPRSSPRGTEYHSVPKKTE